MTGFFLEVRGAVRGHVDDLAELVADRGRCDIGIRTLVDDGLWIGLELDAPELRQLGENYRDIARSVTLVSPIRPKSWMHLSLAYRHPETVHDRLAALAGAVPWTSLDAGWELRLYERDGTEWTVHGAWPLEPGDARGSPLGGTGTL